MSEKERASLVNSVVERFGPNDDGVEPKDIGDRFNLPISDASDILVAISLTIAAISSGTEPAEEILDAAVDKGLFTADNGTRLIETFEYIVSQRAAVSDRIESGYLSSEILPSFVSIDTTVDIRGIIGSIAATVSILVYLKNQTVGSRSADNDQKETRSSSDELSRAAQEPGGHVTSVSRNAEELYAASLIETLSKIPTEKVQQLDEMLTERFVSELSSDKIEQIFARSLLTRRLLTREEYIAQDYFFKEHRLSEPSFERLLVARRYLATMSALRHFAHPPVQRRVAIDVGAIRIIVEGPANVEVRPQPRAEKVKVERSAERTREVPYKELMSEEESGIRPRYVN
jgi:hypothetical protein